jgi:FkbM family methyltransferase
MPDGTEGEIDGFIEKARCRYGTMFFFTSDKFLGRSLREYGEWAQREIDLLHDLLDGDSVVVDVGAFIGTHTLAFASWVRPRGSVYAFEPHPTYFSVLQRNIDCNGLSNVRPFNVGLSDEQQEMEMVTLNLQDESNLGHACLLPRSEDSECIINVKRLDDFQFERCDLLKIDAEGMEHRILKGAAGTIQYFRPLVFAECNSVAEGWRVIQLMQSRNYGCYLQSARAFNPQNYRGGTENFFGDAREVGLLFVPTDKPERFRSSLQEKHLLVPISSLDGLVLGLLTKPQYKYEVLARTDAAQILGVDFWGNESDLSRLKGTVEQREEQVAKVQASLESARRDVEFLEAREAALLTRNEALETSILQLYASRSWRITGPLRLVGTVIRTARAKRWGWRSG